MLLLDNDHPIRAPALLSEARELAGTDSAALAAVALAECGVLADPTVAAVEPKTVAPEAITLADSAGTDRMESETLVHEAILLARRSVELADRTRDPLLRSAALDVLAAAQCWAGDTFAAADTTRRRVAWLTSMPLTPASALERVNAWSEAADIGIGVGDLRDPRRWAEQLRDLPLLAERGDFATSALLVAEALVGNLDEVLTGSRRFIDSRELSGRRSAPSLAPAAAMAHGLRGDDESRAEWLAIVDSLGGTSDHQAAYRAVFDAIVLLDRGHPERALAELVTEPDALDEHTIWIRRHWYVALRADAAVLAGHPDARGFVAAAGTTVSGNPIAGPIVERAAALLVDDPARLLALAADFERAHCPCRHARSLTLVDHRG